MPNNERTKPESHEVTLPHHNYQPSKAKLEEDLRVDATFEQQVKTVMRPVRIRYVKPSKRK